jgi:hypothetical protein
MIIVVNSNSFKSIFSDNKNCDFRVCLLDNVQFSTTAQIAIREIIIPPIDYSVTCYILCSAANYSQLNENWRRIIRLVRLEASTKYQHITFAQPIYYDLLNPSFDNIRFSLKSETDDFVTFKKEAFDTTIVFELLWPHQYSQNVLAPATANSNK